MVVLNSLSQTNKELLNILSEESIFKVIESKEATYGKVLSINKKP